MDTLEETMATSAMPGPWRRFFARVLDLFIYNVIWSVFISLVLGENIAQRGGVGEFFDTVVAMILMLLIEPVLLHTFGTTIGKAILGIHITDNSGKRLFYGEALSRTWTVMLLGFGVQIPGFNLYRLWRSFKNSDEGNKNEWEYDSMVILRDKRTWRTLVYIVLHIVLITLLVGTNYMVQIPKHRGDISAEQFCENYNHLAKFYKLDSRISVRGDGKIGASQRFEEDAAIINLVDSEVNYTYKENQGIMTEIGFSLSEKDSDNWMPSYPEERILAIKSFVAASKQCGVLPNEVDALVDKIADHPNESFETELYGIKVCYKVDVYGYESNEDIAAFCPGEIKERHCNISFSMKKQ